MFARLTFLKTLPENFEKVKKIYNEEIVPVVRAQKGNIGCWLLEPTNQEDDWVSLTEWTSSVDADAYHASGTYQELVDKIKPFYTGKPQLKTYNVAQTPVTATAHL
jgi:quinol monooxygenase YgiN